MTDVAHGDLAALARQADALRRFREDATDAMRLAERAAADAVQAIVDELSRRRADLARAVRELNACRRDERRTCAGEEQAVLAAQQRVEAAEQAARLAQRALEDFSAPRTRFVRETAVLEGQGVRLLTALSSDLEAYLEGAAPTGGGAIAERGAPVGRTSGLPEGWAMVPVAAIDDADSGVSGPESFGKGYSPADLSWAYDALHEVVLPAMARGKSADYFAARDQAEGRWGTRSYSDTYTGFFGADSSITLDRRADGSYAVGNGYHRIWVARQLGLDVVPARVR